MNRPVEATSVAGFVQQLAVQYVGRGYFFFVTGLIPAHKDPALTDVKLCDRYGVARSKWARARRKALGLANHVYLRFGRFFCLLSTHGRAADGEPDFFAEEATRLRDARKTPIRFQGYTISYRGGHVHVRIDQQRYLELKSYLVAIAPVRGTEEMLIEMKTALRFEPYAPIRSQSRCILRAVNRARRDAGLETLPATCLRMRRQIVRPFAPHPATNAA